jgi:hypothetical protein
MQATFPRCRGKVRPPRENAPRGSARRPQRSPDRQASIERRRRLANRALPDALAARFTCGEKATLAVIGQTVQKRGACDLSIGEIAARAGVSHRLAQQAIRLAEKLGLLAVRERRLSRFRNATNIIHIISAEWRVWLRLGGCRNAHGAQNKFRNQTKTHAESYAATASSKRLGEEVSKHGGGARGYGA